MTATQPQSAPRVCVGKVVGAHGVRGQVKLKSFTQTPTDVAAYGPLQDEAGLRRFKVALSGLPKDGVFVARLEGVADRNAAEALKGVNLYVLRAALPEPEEEEFYYADLIGLRAETEDGELFGTVTAAHDFGAGDVLELRLANGAAGHLPFTRAAVPVVDVKGGRVVVRPPDEIEVRGDVSAAADVEIGQGFEDGDASGGDGAGDDDGDQA